MPTATGRQTVVGSPPDPELDPLRAAWLQLGGAPNESCNACVPPMPSSVTVRPRRHCASGTCCRGCTSFYVARRRQPRRSDLRLRVRPQLARGDWRVVDGLPVCTAQRMVGDLLADREDESAVARICQDAVHGDLLDTRQLTALVGPHAQV